MIEEVESSETMTACELVGSNFQIELLTSQENFNKYLSKLTNTTLESAEKELKYYIKHFRIEKVSLYVKLGDLHLEITNKEWELVLLICEKMFEFTTKNIAFALIAHQSQKYWNIWYQKSRNNVLKFEEITKSKDYDVKIFVENNEKGFEETLYDNHLNSLFNLIKNKSYIKPFRRFSILVHSNKAISESGIQKAGDLMGHLEYQKEMKALDFYIFAKSPKPHGIHNMFRSLRSYVNTLEELNLTYASMYTYKDEQTAQFTNLLEEFRGKSLRKLSLYVGSFYLSSKILEKLFQAIENFREQLNTFGFSFWSDNADLSEECLWVLLNTIKKFGPQLTHLNLALLSVRLSNKTLKEIITMLDPIASNLLVFKFYTQSYSLVGESNFINKIATQLHRAVEGEFIPEIIGERNILGDEQLRESTNTRKRLLLATKAIRSSVLLKTFKRRLIIVEILEKFF